jgi:hypothetical protein
LSNKSWRRAKGGLAPFLLILAALCATRLPATPAFAQGETDHAYIFGGSLTITLTLPEDTTTSQARLVLRAGESATEVHTIALEEGVARYQRDLRARPFAPFVPITYWWEYESAGAEAARTTETTFLYEDNRFEWHELREEGTTVHWVEGNAELWVTALDLTREVLEEMGAELHLAPFAPIRIYIYPSLPDLRVALRLAGREWVGSEAQPEVGVILLAVPADEEAPLTLQSTLPHEIFHLALYRQVGEEAYATLPAWFNEGLASQFEQRAEPAYALALERGREAGRLIPLVELCAPFYHRPTDEVILAYAQSESAVRYLKQTYGMSGARSLLATYADGMGCSQGLEEAIGVGLSAFEREWRLWLEEGGQPAERPQELWALGRVVARSAAPWLLLTALLLLPALILWLRSTTKRSAD